MSITLLNTIAQSEQHTGSSNTNPEQRLLVALSYIEDLRRQLQNAEGKYRTVASENGEMFEEAMERDRQITDKDQQIATLKQRAREHLGEKADLLAEINTLKSEKHDALAQSSKEYCEACQRHDQQAVRQQEIDALMRRVKRLPNTQMGSSDKLYAIDLIEQAAARYYDLKDLSLPFHPVMEQVAERLGLSPSQLTRINKTQKTAGSWNYEVKRTFKERIGKKEIYECEVTISLDKILTEPESIMKPVGPKGAHQGGQRVRLCQDCGSDDLDRYALEYCRSCGKAHAQLLPGLRSDANIHDAITAVKEDRLTIQDHVHDYAEDEESTPTITQIIHELDPEHDALTPTEIDEKHDAPTSNVKQLPPIESKMQDKVAVRESLQVASSCSCCKGIERGTMPVQPCWQCHNRIWQWNHLNHRWICAVCPTVCVKVEA